VTDSHAAEFQRRVATIALAACRELGFALAGGQALIAHGIVNRATEDIDIFTDDREGVRRASHTVTAALIAAGYAVSPCQRWPSLTGCLPASATTWPSWRSEAATTIVRVQLARFDRHRAPVVMDIGPVLHVDDVLGSKVATLAARAEPRDYIDVAAALRVRTADDLRRLARQADPTVSDEELRAAMTRLDRLDDSVFTDLYGLSKEAADALRSAFADWPRG
jgi:hypothetical protein